VDCRANHQGIGVFHDASAKLFDGRGQGCMTMYEMAGRGGGLGGRTFAIGIVQRDEHVEGLAVNNEQLAQVFPSHRMRDADSWEGRFRNFYADNDLRGSEKWR
jgi:hypothetical protein